MKLSLISINLKTVRPFWKEVKKRRGNCDNLISEIDAQKSNEKIVNVFHRKFSSVTAVNSQTNATIEFCPNVNFRTRLSSRCVNNAIKALSPGVGYDAIHSNHLKFSFPVMIYIYSKLFNSCIIHNHVPSAMLAAVINPLVKD